MKPRPQPATTNTDPLAPAPFRSLPLELRQAILTIAEQLAIEAAEKYVEGLRDDAGR